jgi:hypothetical protein
MDFIDWATTSQEWIHRGLAAVSGMDSSSGTPATTSSFQQAYPSFDSSAGPPLLSKTSEAELYLLATNFLLCKFGILTFRVVIVPVVFVVM